MPSFEVGHLAVLLGGPYQALEVHVELVVDRPDPRAAQPVGETEPDLLGLARRELPLAVEIRLVELLDLRAAGWSLHRDLGRLVPG